jgi:hypothetical protein
MTSLKDFIEYILTKESIDDILSDTKDVSERGFVFERLWDIMLKFGFCQDFSNKSHFHMLGNANKGKLKRMTSLQQYINNNKMTSGNSTGYSDITLFNEETDKYIFFSSKCYSEEKSVDSYDVEKILAMIKYNDKIYKNWKIVLLVMDKQAVYTKIEQARTSSNPITKNIYKVLDKTDLQKYFLRFKEDIQQYEFEDYDEVYLLSGELLRLRFHQELITNNTLTLINGGNTRFLWGCKCRSGKSYMIGGLINKMYKDKANFNVLIITPVPTETIPQFTTDLFYKFRDFKQFKVHEIKMVKDDIKPSRYNIYIASKQLLQRYLDDNILAIPKLDLLFFDENHYTGTTELSKKIISTYSSDDTVKVYLTATYNKPLTEWNIPTECQMYWDIEDENLCKTKNIVKLESKHQNVQNTIEKYISFGDTIDDIFLGYNKMSTFQFITNLFDSERYVKIKESIKDSKYGFSFETLFSFSDSKKKFRYEEEVKLFLRYITGSSKEIDFKTGDKSIFGRIKRICTESGSRLPFTQIWFLPAFNIDSISKCLVKCMEKDRILSRYDVMIINSLNEDLEKDVKDEINKREILAKENGKTGLILLAGNMLSLGITLHLCDVVMLMNNTISSDRVFQQIYRCMTEADDKKYGFVVDMNINRVLNTFINYNVQGKMTIEEKIRYLMEYHLINIDEDYFYNKSIDIDEIVKNLLEIWKSDPINNFNSLLRNLADELSQFDTETQKLLNKTFYKHDKMNLKIEIKEDGDESQELPKGTERISKDDKGVDEKESKEKDDESEEKKVEIDISFTKDVLPYVIPLVCILTLRSDNRDFVRMLCDIKANKELLEVFDEQSFVWWNKRGLIDIIKEITENNFEKNSNIYNISINFKMSLQSLIDRPKELIEFINDCLKPKDIEKRKYGEVFTPLIFIERMLDDLDEHYKSDNDGVSIFSNSRLKWFDPAVGIGNFPIAIYYRLMDGLKDEIEDELERKIHILKNMIYMSELNKKNCYIVRQIFNGCVNLYEGDSLTLDISSIFGIDRFDVIIGNPPYNKELTKTGALPLYNEFIEYYIEKCDMLSYVVPSRWFSGGKGLDKFRKMMLSRKDLVYINQFDDASKVFGNMVSIEGGVNYFLKDIKYKGDCKYGDSFIELSKFDVFVDSKYYSLIDKLVEYDSITDLYISQDYYKVQTNDSRLTNDTNLLKCYVSQQKGFEKYIEKKHIKKDYNFYKVITARANGKNDCFGNTFIGNTKEIHSKSYISFKLNTKQEAQSLLSYLKCKLPNFMLSLRKCSQDISESTCKWIPLPPLDRTWDDESVYKYFNLLTDDIKLIKSTKIIGFKENYNILSLEDKKYYLIDNQLFNIEKNMNKGDLIGERHIEYNTNNELVEYIILY